jgi:hypothetical protein
MTAAALLAEAQSGWLGGLSDVEARRVLLVRIWVHLRTISAADENDFSKLNHDFTQRVYDLESSMLLSTQIGMPFRNIVIELAAHGAALDRLLGAYTAQSNGRTGQRVFKVDISPDKVPCTYWVAARRRPLGPALPAVRQGALPAAAYHFHRIIPACSSKNFEIDVCELPHELSAKLFKGDDPFVLTTMAAVFADDARLDIDERQKKKFRVLGYKTKGCAQIREDSAFEICAKGLKNPKVNAILFPEMSLTKQSELRVLKRLKHALKEANDSRTLLVLPGSFHEKVGRRWRNTATLYFVNKSLAPTELTTHTKFTTAWIGDRQENISVAERITLLATPRGLILVAICMDFCDRVSAGSAIWDLVEADLVLIPSYGNETTMDLHRARVKDLALRSSFQAILAQQLLESSDVGVIAVKQPSGRLEECDRAIHQHVIALTL